MGLMNVLQSGDGWVRGAASGWWRRGGGRSGGVVANTSGRTYGVIRVGMTLRGTGAGCHDRTAFAYHSRILAPSPPTPLAATGMPRAADGWRPRPPG